MVSRTILSRLRLPFRHIGWYSILRHSYRFLKIGGMFRRDVRNPASTNLQNSTHTREFLVQTRKITKRILSFYPHLPSGVIQWYLVISGFHCAKAKFTLQRTIIWNIHDFSMRFSSTLFFRFGPPKWKLEGCSGGMQGKTLLCLGTKRKESQG